MRYALSLLALAAVLAALPTGISAWEATTTHAGLTEQAALHSRLHQRLASQFGIERGLFGELTVPPADAPQLIEALGRLNPTHGHVPDSRGRLVALGWLAAGAVLADTPPIHAGHHFFDPTTGKGLSDATVRGLGARLRHALYRRLAGDSIVRSGLPAVEWISHADNPMNVAGFYDQYGKAVAATTSAERERHVAGALLAAGALLHVLQDMGSPSHVRDDLAAHLEVVGNDSSDVGSRFERLAALAYGRLGVPAPRRTVTRPSIQAFFAADDKGGLADWTAFSWFSDYTLPGSTRVRPGTSTEGLAQQLTRSLRRPHPAPLPRLDFVTAKESRGAALVDSRGVCVARYQLQQAELSWYLDDECLAEQISVILPEVSAYSAGLLDFLFRATIELAYDKDRLELRAVGSDFAAGTLEIFWDDDRGVRTQYGQPTPVDQAADGQVFAVIPKKLPKQAVAVAAIYRGVDSNGQTLYAAGHRSLAGDKKAPSGK